MKTPDFTFEIKGITLDMCDMDKIHHQYEIYCTAEYLMENYALNEEQALKHASDVRRIMNKYGYCEDDAIIKIVGYPNEN